MGWPNPALPTIARPKLPVLRIILDSGATHRLECSARAQPQASHGVYGLTGSRTDWPFMVQTDASP